MGRVVPIAFDQRKVGGGIVPQTVLVIALLALGGGIRNGGCVALTGRRRKT
jgi:hypothetical protein